MQQPDPIANIVRLLTGEAAQPPDIDCPRRVVAHPKVTTHDPVALVWSLYHAPAAESEGGDHD